jgi:hypothetical protein
MPGRHVDCGRGRTATARHRRKRREGTRGTDGRLSVSNDLDAALRELWKRSGTTSVGAGGDKKMARVLMAGRHGRSLGMGHRMTMTIIRTACRRTRRTVIGRIQCWVARGAAMITLGIFTGRHCTRTTGSGARRLCPWLRIQAGAPTWRDSSYVNSPVVIRCRNGLPIALRPMICPLVSRGTNGGQVA